MEESWHSQAYQAQREASTSRDWSQPRPTRRWYSRCSVGKGRAFWIVEQDAPLGSDEFPEIVASGYASSLEEAERLAKAEAGPDARPGYAYGAAREHRKRAVQERLARGSTSTEGARREFLYRRSTGWTDMGTHYDDFYPHLIIKRTATRVYVDKEMYDDVHQAYIEKYPHDLKTVIIDRATLERDGHADATGMDWWGGRTFYVRPEADPNTGETPACLLALQLTWPCTRKDIQRSFRRLAKQVHPDQGGTALAFRALRQAQQEALAWVKGQAIAP